MSIISVEEVQYMMEKPFGMITQEEREALNKK
jgi:hypothetical protein